jgi:hypothetical protein
MYREHGVEQVGEADPQCLRHEAEERAVAVETPRPTLLNDFQAWLVVTVEKLVGDLAASSLVRQLESVRSEPLGLNDGD